MKKPTGELSWEKRRVRIGEADNTPHDERDAQQDDVYDETPYGKMRRGDGRDAHNDTTGTHGKDGGEQGRRRTSGVSKDNDTMPYNNGQSGLSHARAATGNGAWKTTAPGGDDLPRYLRRTPTTRRYAASPPDER